MLRNILSYGGIDNAQDLERKTPPPATKEQVASMLRTLLAERFKLTQHTDTRSMSFAVNLSNLHSPLADLEDP